MWTKNIRPTLYTQCLAWKITIEHSIDTADGIKLVESIKLNKFKKKIVIQAKKY